MSEYSSYSSNYCDNPMLLTWFVGIGIGILVLTLLLVILALSHMNHGLRKRGLNRFIIPFRPAIERKISQLKTAPQFSLIDTMELVEVKEDEKDLNSDGIEDEMHVFNNSTKITIL